MKPFRLLAVHWSFLVLLAFSCPATAKGPQTQAEKDALGAFVVEKMLEIQVAACQQHVPGEAEVLETMFREWRASRADSLVSGAALFLKYAPEIAPGLSPDAYLEQLRQVERQEHSNLTPGAWPSACNGLISWFSARSPRSASAGGTESEFTAKHGSFAFSQKTFSARFMLDSSPLRVEPRPRERGDHVVFTSSGGMFPFVFEVASWPTGADPRADLADAEAKAKSSPDVLLVEMNTPCRIDERAEACLIIRDIVYKDKLPIYARESILFQAHGWTYSVSAANFAPSTMVTTEMDMKDFHPEGSLSNARAALKAFMAAFRPLGAK